MILDRQNAEIRCFHIEMKRPIWPMLREAFQSIADYNTGQISGFSMFYFYCTLAADVMYKEIV